MWLVTVVHQSHLLKSKKGHVGYREKAEKRSFGHMLPLRKKASETARRSKFDIMTEILVLCKKPQTKTFLLHKTGLSYKILENHLAQLQSFELLQIRHSITRYETTEKGLKFIEKSVKLNELLVP